MTATETIVCFILENKLGDVIGFFDTLQAANAEAARLAVITGHTYRVIEHRDTDGRTEQIEVGCALGFLA